MFLFVITEELSDMRKQMKALEEKNVTYMKETMNLQEVCPRKFFSFAVMQLKWTIYTTWNLQYLHIAENCTCTRMPVYF